MSGNSKKKIKIWTAVKDAKAGMMITDTTALMVADKSNFVATTPDGTVVAGKSVVLQTVSENIRNGGLFVKMNDIVQMVPSTLVTPTPGQIPFPPVSLAMNITEDLAYFVMLAGGMLGG